MNIRKFPCPCNLSETSLIEAASFVGPAFVYQLHVCPDEVPLAIHLCKKLSARYEDNPLAPYINVVADGACERGRWFLEANDRRMVSDGVGGI